MLWVAMCPEACISSCAPVFFPCFAWSALVKRVLTIPFFADVPPVDESLLHAALKVDVERIRVREEGLRRLSRARALAVAGVSSRFRRRVRHYLAFTERAEVAVEGINVEFIDRVDEGDHVGVLALWCVEGDVLACDLDAGEECAVLEGNYGRFGPVPLGRVAVR